MDETSAAPSLPDVERAGIQADHSHMCKFDSDTAPGFEKVTEVIQRYAEDSPDIIKSRWKSEREERTTQRIQKAQEIFPFNPGKTMQHKQGLKMPSGLLAMLNLSNIIRFI